MPALKQLKMTLGLTASVIKAIVGACVTAGATHLLGNVDWAPIFNKLGKAGEELKELIENYKTVKDGKATDLMKEQIDSNKEEEYTPPTAEPGNNNAQQPTNKVPQVIPNISDTTQENVEVNTNNSFSLNGYMKEYEERQRALIDEMKEWESSRYQRTVRDMQRAGINPNLMGNIDVGGANPIAEMSSMNADELITFIESEVKLLEQTMQNEFNLSQNEIKYGTQLITGIIAAVTMFATKGIKLK